MSVEYDRSKFPAPEERHVECYLTDGDYRHAVKTAEF